MEFINKYFNHTNNYLQWKKYSGLVEYSKDFLLLYKVRFAISIAIKILFEIPFVLLELICVNMTSFLAEPLNIILIVGPYNY